jgi:hypothetical protein
LKGLRQTLLEELRHLGRMRRCKLELRLQPRQEIRQEELQLQQPRRQSKELQLVLRNEPSALPLEEPQLRCLLRIRMRMRRLEELLRTPVLPRQPLQGEEAEVQVQLEEYPVACPLEASARPEPPEPTSEEPRTLAMPAILLALLRIQEQA